MPDRRLPSGWRTALVVARKDLAIEYRTRSAFLSAVVFSLLSLAIFYFTWDPTAIGSADLLPGVLWTTFTFSGLLGLHRSFGVEEADRALDALLAAPVPREAIFAGKGIANLLFVLGVQAVSIPAALLLYNVGVGLEAFLAICAVAVLAAVGLVAVGTLFSAIAVHTRLRELLLPLLALPFFVPVVTAAAQATSRMLAGRPASESLDWLKLLLAYDLVFVFVTTLVFPHTLED